MWRQATQLKREQLEDLISQVKDPTLKANMLYTLSKLMKRMQVGQCSECKEMLYTNVSELDFTERFGPRQVIPIRTQCKHKYQVRYITRSQFKDLPSCTKSEL